MVHAAEVPDGEGARRVLAEANQACPRLEQLWADRQDGGQGAKWAKEHLNLEIEVVQPDEAAAQGGLVVLPRRWVVERSFAWFGRNRRLAKDYEHLPSCSQAMLYLASIQLLARRLATNQTALLAAA